MTNVNLEIQKAMINYAFNNNDITPSQYQALLKTLKTKEEELNLQIKLKEYKDKEIVRKYNELSLS